jgi:hypothetical protein
MLRFGATVSVLQQAALEKAVIVWAAPPFHEGHGGDAQRDFREDRGLEDAGRAEERYPCAPEVEALFEDDARQGRVTVTTPQVGKDFEGAKTHGCVEI